MEKAQRLYQEKTLEQWIVREDTLQRRDLPVYATSTPVAAQGGELRLFFHPRERQSEEHAHLPINSRGADVTDGSRGCGNEL